MAALSSSTSGAPSTAALLDEIFEYAGACVEAVGKGRSIILSPEAERLLSKKIVWLDAAQIILESLKGLAGISYPIDIKIVTRELPYVAVQIATTEKMVIPFLTMAKPMKIISRKVTILVSQHILKFPFSALIGAFAHELGHLVNDDITTNERLVSRLDKLLVRRRITPLTYELLRLAESRCREYEADSYAIKLGFGRQQVEYTRLANAVVAGLGEERPIPEIFCSHPSDEKRIARIQSLLSSLVPFK